MKRSLQKETQTNWIILNREKNSFGDLFVVFYNIKTQKKLESLFSEGEHSQAGHMLKHLNEEEN